MQGNEVFYLEAGLSGHTSWTAPVAQPGQYVKEVAVLTDAGAAFSVLTGGGEGSSPMKIDAALAGKTLPKGSYELRLSAITITSGAAILLLS